jgi:hypothetical protein
MDAKMLAEAADYERLTQSVYQAILRKENSGNIEVQHNLDITGLSGVAHQVDVSWRFRRATVEHHVLIECKNYASDITLEKVRNFFAVLRDIGNCQGIMVTKTGYQSGVVDFAKYYGIGLKLLRKPTDEDWEGRVKNICINIRIIPSATVPEKALQIELLLATDTPPEIANAVARRELVPAQGPDVAFVDSSGTAISEGLHFWASKAIAKEGTGAGGPFTKVIPLENHYAKFVEKSGGSRFLKIASVKIVYYREFLEERTILIEGEQIVEAVLKDFASGQVEHVQRK